MNFEDVARLQEEISSQLSYDPLPRRVRINPQFYHQVCSIIDEIDTVDPYGSIQIIEDTTVNDYEFEY